MKHIYKLFRLYLIGLITLSTISWSATTGTIMDKISPAKGTSVQKITKIKGKDFELRNVSYKDKQGHQQSIDLYFIYSEKGAKNAYAKGDLSKKDKDELLQDFKTSAALQKSKANKGQGDYNLIIIDKELSEADTIDDKIDVLLSRGLNKKEINELLYGKTNSKGHSRRSCPNLHNRKIWEKSFNEEIDRDETLQNTNLSVDIDANLNVHAKATLRYTVPRSHFLWGCIRQIWRIRLNSLELYANYSILGSMDVDGNVDYSNTFNGITWNIARPTIAMGRFWYAFVSFDYRITLPITAGTGNLEVDASGDITVDGDLDMNGRMKYRCVASGCHRELFVFNNNNSVDTSSIEHNLMASAKIEPWIKVAVNGKLDASILLPVASIEAEVGVKPSLPIVLSAGLSNMCGNGDGLGNNESVSWGILDIDFRVGIEAKARFGALFWNWNVLDNYYELYRANLYFMDFLNPSTAFSPVIRPHAEGLTVTMPVSLRSCISSIADTDYQDFIIDWGDDTTTPINNLSTMQTFTHTYTNEGTYTISVTHANGASTSKQITVRHSIDLVPNISSNTWINADRIRNKLFINGRIFASNSPSRYQVKYNNRIIYTGNNRNFFKLIRISIWHPFSFVSVRAKNNSGWGSWRNFRINFSDHPFDIPTMEQ